MTGIGLFLALTAFADDARYAVVVGSNEAAAGRPALRYARDDASAVSRALTDLGEFSDVTVLFDPRPDAILDAIDGALTAAEESGPGGLVLFYYSGHADERSLYPGGRTLSLERLKDLIDGDDRAAVRLGIIDACRGGSWTGAKGLVLEDAPFEVTLPTTLESEGTVFIASSSGSESAHEGSVVGGSFFTHHLVAGLRGAADGDDNGQISLSEAFDYAKRGTVRDAVLYAAETQTPSFDLHLRGKQDLVLTRVDQGTSSLSLAQVEGPLEVVHLDSGVVVLLLDRGEREVKLALPPGNYLIRRRDFDGVYAMELKLRAGRSLWVDETQLQLRGEEALVTKGGRDRRLQPSQAMLGAGRGEIRVMSSPLLGFGSELVSTTPSSTRLALGFLGFGVGATVGVTDELQLSLPAVVAVSPLQRKHEAVVWGGLTGVARQDWTNYRYTEIDLRVGLDWIWHIGDRTRLRVAGSAGVSPRVFDTGFVEEKDPERHQATMIAFSRTFGRRLTLNVPLELKLLWSDASGSTVIDRHELSFAPSTLRGGRPLPLLQFHASDRVTLDANYHVGRRRSFDVSNGFYRWSTSWDRSLWSSWLGVTVSL